jgi:hypothetical protein
MSPPRSSVRTTFLRDQCGGGLIYLGEGYLVIVGIKKTREFTSGHEIYDLINVGKGKQIFQTCLSQARVVNAHPPFPILFWYKNLICYPVWVLDFFNKASG